MLSAKSFKQAAAQFECADEIIIDGDRSAAGSRSHSPAAPAPDPVLRQYGHLADTGDTCGVIVDELGPDTLLAELRKVHREDTPHVAVATLLDWFASYVYLSRLRDNATLTLSIEKLIGRIESPVAFAKSFDEADKTYAGVTQWSATLASATAGGLLVWRKALPDSLAPDETGTEDKGARVADGGDDAAAADESGEADGKKQPKSFYGSVTLDPDNCRRSRMWEEGCVSGTHSRPRGAAYR